MRDPASRLIRWFGLLMLAVLTCSAFITGWALWELGRLVCAVLKG
jgi:hypothetical protein